MRVSAWWYSFFPCCANLCRGFLQSHACVVCVAMLLYYVQYQHRNSPQMAIN